MAKANPSGDRRRELALWVLVGADMSALPYGAALDAFETAFVGEPAPPSALEASEYFRVERFEDYLPTPVEWLERAPEVRALVNGLAGAAEAVDAAIVAASPRWRLDRMPVIDRSLLRLGVHEMLHMPEQHARATINGCVELAKRFGSPTTPAFVNGILDQIRRDREIPIDGA